MSYKREIILSVVLKNLIEFNLANEGQKHSIQDNVQRVWSSEEEVRGVIPLWKEIDNEGQSEKDMLGWVSGGGRRQHVILNQPRTKRFEHWVIIQWFSTWLKVSGVLWSWGMTFQ